MTATTFIVDEKGKRISAIVPIKKYEQLLEESDELEDIKAYDKAMSRKQEFVPLEQAISELELTWKKKN